MTCIVDLLCDLRALRRNLSTLFEHDGWSVERRELIERLDEIIAKAENQGATQAKGET